MALARGMVAKIRRSYLEEQERKEAIEIVAGLKMSIDQGCTLGFEHCVYAGGSFGNFDARLDFREGNTSL